MLPIVVLRRLDCVLEPTKGAVLRQYARLTAQNMPENAIERLLGRTADPNRTHPLYNTSPFTFQRRTSRPISSPTSTASRRTARGIFERFKFNDHTEKLDASNRLFTIVRAMADVDLHPDRIDNLQMGYLFEHQVMRFNEQANEQAGDHFTPREVIRLMANLIYTGERDVYRPGIYRTICDPACGTGGMLSESENSSSTRTVRPTSPCSARNRMTGRGPSAARTCSSRTMTPAASSSATPWVTARPATVSRASSFTTCSPARPSVWSGKTKRRASNGNDGDLRGQVVIALRVGVPLGHHVPKEPQ